jgi:hypothetical protein
MQAEMSDRLKFISVFKERTECWQTSVLDCYWKQFKVVVNWHGIGGDLIHQDLLGLWSSHSEYWRFIYYLQLNRLT